MDQKQRHCVGDMGSTPWVFAALAALVRPLPTLLAYLRLPMLVPFNFHPVGGLAMYAGARVHCWVAYGLPLLVMVVSDVFLWLVMGPDYSPLHLSRPFVYGSFLVYVFLGRTLAKSTDPLRIGLTILAGSLQFFLITNLGAWLVHPEDYARDLAGLLSCYQGGLSSFPANVAGDLLFGGGFFALHALWNPASRPAIERVSQ